MDPLFFLVALQLTPRAAVLPLTPGALSLQQRSRIEAGLAVQGYSGVDPVDRAALLDDSDEAPRDSRALYVEARKAFLDFDYPKARRLLDRATRDLLESPRFLPERSLMADVHLLRAQIEQSEQREVDARAELQSVAVLEPQRTLHPGLYPPDLVSAYGEVKKSLASRSRGALEVRSRPPGAAVYVDAQPGGSAPLVVDSLVAGRHYVTVSVPRLGSRTRSIELAAGRSTRVEIFVSDPAQRAPARQALRELRRGSPSAERMRPVLDYLGAELLLLVDAQARVELAFVDAQRRVQLRHFRLPPEEGVEPILARVVQEIHEQEARSARPEDAPKVRVEDDAPSPLLWGGVGLAGLGALVAGGVGLALWLAPRETPAPEERVVIYLGGGSSP